MPPAPPAFELAWSSDRALRVALGTCADEATGRRVHAAAARLRAARLAGNTDVTPAYASLLLTFDLAHLDPEATEARVRALLVEEDTPEGAAAPPHREDAGAAARREDARAAARRHALPLCVCAACGPDLAALARELARRADDIVHLFVAARFRVQMLGFTPGFPYLLGLPAQLEVGRLETPRARVPGGSVAIAGAQAGIYPRPTPGGWRLLGRTTALLFDARRAPPALLAAGDEVEFVLTEHAAPTHAHEQAS